MEYLEYVVDSYTIAEMLGKQNFSSPFSAILELVKNAYDAESNNVSITIDSNMIEIIDDGCGMNEAGIKDYWMHVGTSIKKNLYSIDNGNGERILAGSKGVGRFAIARLGAEAVVQTRMKGEPSCIWETDWHQTTLKVDKEPDIPKGTKITIRRLSPKDRWTKTTIHKLVNFLRRTYDDDKMRIQINYQGQTTEVKRLFENCELGKNCLAVIRMDYRSANQSLTVDIKSDEFTDDVKKLVSSINPTGVCQKIDIFNELVSERGSMDKEMTDDEWRENLKDIGDFSAELYFSLRTSPGRDDIRRFHYKHSIMDERYDYGIILFRNAFGISSYDGTKDWLELGKRYRKSPAAASHPTGRWRVRDNQMSGKVLIDKDKNRNLADLMNRQGLEENDSYKLFCEIILAGIDHFERYRQSIIRKLSPDQTKETIAPPVIRKVLKKPSEVRTLTDEESKELTDGIRDLQKKNNQSRQKLNEIEKQYRYDIRLLNTFATSGLHALAIAHEMDNDRNAVENSVDMIITALQEYDIWNTLSDKEHTQYVYQNVPSLLERCREVNNKTVQFMNVMLTETEKDKYVRKDLHILEVLKNLSKRWERDYAILSVHLDVPDDLVFSNTEDTFQTIFDNLILNSVQQNEKLLQRLEITISVRKKEMLEIDYCDNGVGLHPKYRNDPMRILEVHETTRSKGHGMGMWIVNNTVINSGGKVLSIEGHEGFCMNFTIGNEV